MQRYDAYFLASGDHILDVRSIEAADYGAAEARAAQFCHEHPGCAAVEIWHRGVLLHRHVCALNKTHRAST